MATGIGKGLSSLGRSRITGIRIDAHLGADDTCGVGKLLPFDKPDRHNIAHVVQTGRVTVSIGCDGQFRIPYAADRYNSAYSVSPLKYEVVNGCSGFRDGLLGVVGICHTLAIFIAVQGHIPGLRSTVVRDHLRFAVGHERAGIAVRGPVQLNARLISVVQPRALGAGVGHVVEVLGDAQSGILVVEQCYVSDARIGLVPVHQVDLGGIDRRGTGSARQRIIISGGHGGLHETVVINLTARGHGRHVEGNDAAGEVGHLQVVCHSLPAAACDPALQPERAAVCRKAAGGKIIAVAGPGRIGAGISAAAGILDQLDGAVDLLVDDRLAARNGGGGDRLVAGIDREGHRPGDRRIKSIVLRHLDLTEPVVTVGQVDPAQGTIGIGGVFLARLLVGGRHGHPHFIAVFINGLVLQLELGAGQVAVGVVSLVNIELADRFLVLDRPGTGATRLSLVSRRGAGELVDHVLGLVKGIAVRTGGISEGLGNIIGDRIAVAVRSGDIV